MPGKNWGGASAQEHLPWGRGLSPGAPPLGAGPQPHIAHGSLVFSLEGRLAPSLIRGLLAVSLTVNALFTSAYLYQSLR